MAENLLFGTPVGKQFDGDNIAADPYVQSVLTATGLDLDLQRMGLTIAETMVELFSGLSPDNPLFEQYSFISADELPNVRLLLQRLGGKGIEAVPDADRPRLMTLPLPLHRGPPSPRPDRRGDGRAPAGGAARLRRRACRADCAAPSSSTTSAATTAPPPCRTTSCSAAWSTARPRREQRIGTLIAEVLDELGLRDSVIEVGLEYNVGVAGKRLPATQRQKLGIARALIKRPQLLIVNEAVAVFDGRTQDRIRDNILAAAKSDGRGVVWIANRPAQAEPFEQIVVMQGGRIAAQGAPADLAARGGLYAELMASA